MSRHTIDNKYHQNCLFQERLKIRFRKNCYVRFEIPNSNGRSHFFNCTVSPRYQMYFFILCSFLLLDLFLARFLGLKKLNFSTNWGHQLLMSLPWLHLWTTRYRKRTIFPLFSNLKEFWNIHLTNTVRNFAQRMTALSFSARVR